MLSVGFDIQSLTSFKVPGLYPYTPPPMILLHVPSFFSAHNQGISKAGASSQVFYCTCFMRPKLHPLL